VVVTSDHGEEIFEHGYVLHGQPYVETGQVPLVMRGPGVPADLRVPHLAGLVDLAPTLLSLLGLSELPHAQGRDLSPLLRGGEAVRDAVFVDGVYDDGRTWGSSIVADLAGERFAYVTSVRAHGSRGVRRFVAEEPGELYALDADPQQQSDVAAERGELARGLRERLVAWYRSNELRARAITSSPVQRHLSSSEEEALEALGYAR
jgi:choline-sulfatase